MTEPQPRKPFYRKLYEGWLAIAGHFGEVQTLAIIGITYVFMIGPASIFMSRKDPLHKRGLRTAGSAWLEAESTVPDLERAKRLF